MVLAHAVPFYVCVYIHYAEHACLISVRTTRINFMSIIMLSRVAFMLQLNGISIGA